MPRAFSQHPVAMNHVRCVRPVWHALCCVVCCAKRTCQTPTIAPPRRDGCVWNIRGRSNIHVSPSRYQECHTPGRSVEPSRRHFPFYVSANAQIARGPAPSMVSLFLASNCFRCIIGGSPSLVRLLSRLPPLPPSPLYFCLVPASAPPARAKTNRKLRKKARMLSIL